MGGGVVKPSSKFCTARHYDPDATCELPRHGDERLHKAEVGPPIVVQTDKGPAYVAQVVSW
jgi:hypothetical protein